MKTGKKKYIHTSSPKNSNGSIGGSTPEEITAHVYMTDFMIEQVSEFACFNYYDRCLHGCSIWGIRPCTCPIEKPFISRSKFVAYHLAPGADETPVKVARWKALEIINDWNENQTKESLKQKRQCRWVYFLP
jgi:hypothetical protein